MVFGDFFSVLATVCRRSEPREVRFARPWWLPRPQPRSEKGNIWVHLFLIYDFDIYRKAMRKCIWFSKCSTGSHHLGSYLRINAYKSFSAEILLEHLSGYLIWRPDWDHRTLGLFCGLSIVSVVEFVYWIYRVTIQVVSNLPLTSKQKFHISIRPMY